MSPSEHKSLVVQENDLEKKLRDLRADLKKQKENLAACESLISTTKYRLEGVRKSLTPKKEVVVTEHATLRYIERVYKLNITDVVNEIRTADVQAFADKFKSGKVGIAPGVRAVVQNGTVVTVEAGNGN